MISGIANNDMKPEDAAAFCKIADMVSRGLISFVGSTVTKEELDRISTTYRSSHLNVYDALKKIGASKATWIDTNVGSTLYGFSVQDPVYKELRETLKDENDARLVFQGKMAGVNTFLTIDYKTILKKSDILAKQGVHAVSPSQFLSSTIESE